MVALDVVIDSWNHRRRIVKEKARATCDFSFFFFFLISSSQLVDLEREIFVNLRGGDRRIDKERKIKEGRERDFGVSKCRWRLNGGINGDSE